MEKQNSSSTSKLPPLPWHIYVDKSKKGSGVKSGRLVHVNEPKYECRFFIGDKVIEADGLVIHNVSTGVQLYDLVLPNELELKSNFVAINKSMKEAARFVYDMLYLPYFRK